MQTAITLEEADFKGPFLTGFHSLMAHKGALIGGTFLCGLVTLLQMILPELVGMAYDSSLLNAALWIILYGITLLFQMGFIRMVIKACVNLTPSLSDLTACSHLLIKYTLATVLYLLLVAVGFVLFIIPGIYIAVRFGYYGFFIVDQGLSPIEALKAAFRQSEGSFLFLLLFGTLVSIANGVGFLFLGLGALITFPITMVAMACVFRELLMRQSSPA